MPTLVLVDGFEAAGATMALSGGALATTLTGSAANWTWDSSTKRTGGFALKLVQDAVTANYINKTLTTIGTTHVGSIYIYATTPPGVQSSIFGSVSGVQYNFRLETDGKLSALYLSGTAQSTAASVCDSTWHRVDWYSNSANNPWVLQWKVDGTTQTNATRTLATANHTGLRLGSSGSTHNATVWFDDFVLSVTPGDYPIGEHAVYPSLPSSDGTHVNVGSGMEDNAGSNISTTAYTLLNTWPPTSTTFLRQSLVGPTDYAEVNFADHDGAIDTIWDVSAWLANSSSTNAANEGGCIVSADSFSTSFEVFGNPTTRANYQTTTPTGFSYKVGNLVGSEAVVTRPAGGWTTTNFDALQARLGYSNDVTGNPRWNALVLQYAAVVGGPPPPTGETDFVGEIPI